MGVGHDVLDVDVGGVVLASERDHGSCDGVVVLAGGDERGGGEQRGVEPVVGQGACTDVGLAEFHEVVDFVDVFGSQGRDDHKCSSMRSSGRWSTAARRSQLSGCEGRWVVQIMARPDSVAA